MSSSTKSTASSIPPQPSAITEPATWNSPALVVACDQEARPATFPYCQLAITQSRLAADLDPLSAPTTRILDLCAGTGVLTFAALPFVAHATCTDFAEGMVAAVKERADQMRAGAKVTAEVCDCTDLSAYGDSSFDAVFCMFGLFMVPWDDRRKRAIREMHRVVKKGGCVVLANWSSFDKCNFHSLLFSCIRHAMQAKTAFKQKLTAEASAGDGTVASTAAAQPPAASSSPPNWPPQFPLRTEDEHRSLFSHAPFASVTTRTTSLPSRLYMCAADFWYSVKSLIPLWEYGSDEEERCGDAGAVEWLSGVMGRNSSFVTYSSAVMAMGVK